MNYAVMNAMPQDLENKGDVVEVLPVVDNKQEAIRQFEAKYRGKEYWLYEYEMSDTVALDCEYLQLIACGPTMMLIK